MVAATLQNIFFTVTWRLVFLHSWLTCSLYYGQVNGWVKLGTLRNVHICNTVK